VTFTARGIHCLSSGAPELALELFNLVRATPRAAIGQLESTRRAMFLGASLSKSANRGRGRSAGLRFRLGSDHSDAYGWSQMKTTETKTETGLSPSFLTQEETAWSRDASQVGARPVGRGRRRGDLPVNGESVLIFMVLAAGGLTGHRGGLHLGQPQPARDLVDGAIATRMDCLVVAYKAGVTIRFRCAARDSPPPHVRGSPAEPTVLG
jgi:hypothetical protein